MPSDIQTKNLNLPNDFFKPLPKELFINPYIKRIKQGYYIYNMTEYLYKENIYNSYSENLRNMYNSEIEEESKNFIDDSSEEEDDEDSDSDTDNEIISDYNFIDDSREEENLDRERIFTLDMNNSNKEVEEWSHIDI